MCLQHVRAAVRLHTRLFLCLHTCVYAHGLCVSAKGQKELTGSARYCWSCVGANVTNLFFFTAPCRVVNRLFSADGLSGAGDGKLPSVTSHDALDQIQLQHGCLIFTFENEKWLISERGVTHSWSLGLLWMFILPISCIFSDFNLVIYCYLFIFCTYSSCCLSD